MTNRVVIIREATVRIVKMLAEKEVKVTQRGSKAFVEYHPSGRPLRVNIPYIPDDATDELLDAVQGFMDHEVAHILFTDYKVLAKANKLNVAKLHNIVEDSFIERKMAAHFAGSGINLRNVGAFFLKQYTDKQLAERPDLAEGVLFVPAVRAWAGQTVFIDYMADKWHYMELIVARLGDSVKELPKCASSQDCLDLALKFKELLESKPEEPEEGEEGKGKIKVKSSKSGKSEEGSPKGDSGAGPADGVEETEEGDPETTSKDESDGVSEDEVPTEGEPEDESKEKSEDESDLVVGKGDGEGEGEKPEDEPSEADDGDVEMTEKDSGASVEKGDEEGSGDKDKKEDGTSMLEELERKMGGKDYDEMVAEALTSKTVEESKDADYLIYTKELDIIEPMSVALRRGHWNDSMLKTMQDQVDHMIGPLQKDLERAMAARSAATWSAGHRSGRLHPSALARLTAFKDDRVFRRKHINDSKDVAVELLVDCSASMGGSKIETAAYAAYGLASVLDRMGLPNEVLGFTTSEYLPSEMHEEERKLGIDYAREMNLYIPILKGFNERLTSESKKRFAALPHVGWLCENVDGESVQIAAHRLAQRRERRKILMVLSDGQPACPGDWRALQRHLKKSVKDVEKSGIDVIALGIQSDAPRHFYSKYMLLDSVSELPSAVMGQLKRLLMS